MPLVLATTRQSVCGGGRRCQSVHPKGREPGGAPDRCPAKLPRSLVRLYPNLVPRVGNGLVLGAARPVAMASIRHGASGKSGEIRPRSQAMVTDRIVPDLSRFFPGVAANRRRCEVEGVVRNAGIDMHPAVVL